MIALYILCYLLMAAITTYLFAKLDVHLNPNLTMPRVSAMFGVLWPLVLPTILCTLIVCGLSKIFVGIAERAGGKK